MLIDLETDVFLGHPDFLHASRGAVTVASASLFVQGGRFWFEKRDRNLSRSDSQFALASWAIDGQGMLADAVSRLNESTPADHRPTLHRRAGPDQPTYARPARGHAEGAAPHQPCLRTRRAEDGRGQGARPGHGRHPPMAADPLFQHRAVAGAVLLRGHRGAVDLDTANATLGESRPILLSEDIASVTAVASFIAWLSAMFAAYRGGDPESGYSLAYWSIAVLAMAIFGLYICVKRMHECGPGSGKLPARYRWAIRIVGFMAIALAGFRC